MKIGIVLSRPPGYSESFLRNKISGLMNNGIQVEIFVDKADPAFRLCPQSALPKQNPEGIFRFIYTLLVNPIRCFRFIEAELKDEKKSLQIVQNLYNCSHLLNSEDLDWVHFGFATMTIGRENIAGALKSKMGISVRGFDISRYPLRFPGIYRKIWRKADKVHVISNALRLKAHQNGLPDNFSCTRITPAIDTTFFRNENEVRPLTGTFYILTVARLHWSKGLEYTIKAMSFLKKQGLNFHYTIVGDGKDLERLTLAAHQYDVRECITFAGKHDQNETKIYYQDADLYLQYSVQEGFCNAALEAQAMGLLCIASDAEGLPENIIDGETGWIVPQRSPELLAAKIIEILNTNSETLNLVRQQAKAHVMESFNLGKQNKEILQFFTGS